MTGGHFRDHLPVVGCGPEYVRLERNNGDRIVAEGLGKVRGLDFRPFGYPNLVQAVERTVVVRSRRSQKVKKILGVAQIGEIRRSDNQNVVSANQRAPRPARPEMRHIEDNVRNTGAQRVEDGIEGLWIEIVDPIKGRRRRQHTQIVRAFRQEPIHEGGINPVWREYRIGDSLRWVLIEIETGRAERQIEIRHDGIELQVARNGPRDIVGDRGSANATLGADNGNHAADRLGIGGTEQSANPAYDIEWPNRSDEVFADAASDQLAVEHDVIEPTDDNDAGPRVAHLGELVETREDVLAAAFRFKNDDVGRRRTLERRNGGCHAAHLHAKVRFDHAPVFRGRLHRARRLRGLAKRLRGNAGRGSDVLAVSESLGWARVRLGGLLGGSGHWPTSLILP